MAQSENKLTAMRDTQVGSLGWEDPQEEGMGNPLQYSCLENSMDRGAWRAAVHRVMKSQTLVRYQVQTHSESQQAS